MTENQVEDGDDQPAVEANPEVSDNLLDNCLTEPDILGEEREDSQELLEPRQAAAITCQAMRTYLQMWKRKSPMLRM